MKYLHEERGLAHLDLKGDNFVLTVEFCLSLIDFGMAERLNEVLGDPRKMTPKYRAPEIEKDDEYLGGPADIFGVGVCLYMIIFQAAPFNGKFCLDDKNYKKHFLDQEEPDLSFFNGTGMDLARVPSLEPFEAILRCFNRNPASRPSIEELQ